MLRQFKPVMVFALVMLVLAACDDGSPTATPVPPTATPVPPTSFTLETSGTIAGIHQTLTVDASRNVTFQDGSKPAKTSNVNADAYSNLVAQVAKADFFNLKDNYDSGTVSDDKYYKVLVTQGTQTKTVTLAEIGGKDLAPQALKDLIKLLTDLQTGGAIT